MNRVARLFCFSSGGCRYPVLLGLLVLSTLVWSKGRYLETEDFLKLAFESVEYEAAMLWLSHPQKAILQTILDRKSVGLRVRYWQSDRRTAWIFNEIGKEMPITVGVVLDDNRIAQLHVLEYRESRGGEVRYPFFTQQFLGGQLDKQLKLSAKIDGITGATLSVRAMERVTRAALYLDHQVNPATPINAADAQINAADAQINAADARINAADAKINVADAKINVADAQTNVADAKINVADAKINVADAKINVADAKINVADAQ